MQCVVAQRFVGASTDGGNFLHLVRQDNILINNSMTSLVHRLTASPKLHFLYDSHLDLDFLYIFN